MAWGAWRVASQVKSVNFTRGLVILMTPKSGPARPRPALPPNPFFPTLRLPPPPEDEPPPETPEDTLTMAHVAYVEGALYVWERVMYGVAGYIWLVGALALLALWGSRAPGRMLGTALVVAGLVSLAFGAFADRIEGMGFLRRVLILAAAGALIEGLAAVLCRLTGALRWVYVSAGVVIILSAVGTLVAMHLVSDPDRGNMPPLRIGMHFAVGAVQSFYGVVLLAAFVRRPKP